MVFFFKVGLENGILGREREREGVGLKREESREEIPRQEEGGEDYQRRFYSL